MYGGLGYGGTYYGGLYSQPYQLKSAGTNFLLTRSNTLRPQSPWLHFYELETTDAQFVRVVAFADQDGGSSPNTITFNGNEFAATVVERGEIEQSDALPQIPVTIYDDEVGTIAALLRAQGGLSGATLRLWIIPYDHVATPEHAQRFTFRVKNVTVSDSPNRVTVTIGPPSLTSMDFPKDAYNRTTCLNPWHRRHRHDRRNFCGYPSDEFGLLTRQFLDTESTNNETEKENGWYVVNGILPTPSDGFPNLLRSGYLDTSIVPAMSDRVLIVSIQNENLQWLHATRNGVFLYKKIGVDADEDVEIDVHTRVFLGGLMANTDSVTGILIQSVADPSDWMFWGQELDLVATPDRIRHLYMSTIDGTTTSEEVGTQILPVSEFPSAYRVERRGNEWSFYTRVENPLAPLIEDGTEPVWTLELETDQVVSPPPAPPTFSGAINVGLLAGSLVTGTERYYALFSHFRFDAGGFPACNRSFPACLQRKNTAQFNGFLGMPDGP